MSKEKKYSYIMQWIKKNDIELFDCICDLSMENAFIPNKKSNGITFILPDNNSKIRENILLNTYEETEDLEERNTNKAITLLESLILNDYFPNVKTFEKYNNNGIMIINRLKIKMDIKKIKNNTVIFNNGLIIEDLSIFNENVKKDENNNKYNIAIWKLIEGNSYTDGTKISEQQMLSEIKSNKNYRSFFTQFVENEFIKNIINNNDNNVYLIYVFKILIYLQLKHKSEYIKIKSIIDPDPIITFYLIVEPYKLDNYLIPNSIFSENVINSFMKNNKIYIDEIKNSYKNMLFDTDNDNIINNVNLIKERILNDVGRNVSLYSMESYKILENTNVINKIESILPENLFNHYKKNNYKKIWQDEFRFIIGEDIKNMYLESTIKTKIFYFDKICNKIKTFYTGNNYSNELNINNENDISKILPNCFKDKVTILLCFVKSCDFLFTLRKDIHYHDDRICRHSFLLNKLNTNHHDDDEIDVSFSYQLKKYIDNGKTYEDLINNIS